MCGQEGYYGTSSFSVLLNLRSIQSFGEASASESGSGSGSGNNNAVDYALEDEAHVNKAVLVSEEFVSDMCTTSKLEIAGSNGVGAKPKDLGAVSESYDMGF